MFFCLSLEKNKITKNKLNKIEAPGKYKLGITSTPHYSIIIFLLVCGLGVLSHFLYDWSGQNKIVGIISSINESTWEHLKLIFFPMLFVTIGEIIIFKKKLKEFLPPRVSGILAGMAFIVVVFYTFWGITGKLIDFVNISIYILGVLFAFLVEKYVRSKKMYMDLSVSIAILVGIAVLFVIFSFNNPNVGIFFDLSLHPKG